MQAAANRIPIHGCEIHGLSPDALSGEGGIAVDHNGKNSLFTAHANLLGPHPSGCYWIDGFEVARIGNQMQVNRLTTTSGEGPGCPLVVLHIAAAKHAARINIFELREHVCSGFADDVHHYVKPSAMAHGDYDLHGSAFGSIV